MRRSWPIQCKQNRSPSRLCKLSQRMPKGLLPSSRPRFRLCTNAQLTNNCNMANAFCQAGYPRSTLRDFVLIAELRIVDKLEFAPREICVGSVRELEAVCRRRLRTPASYGEHATRGTAAAAVHGRFDTSRSQFVTYSRYFKSLR